MTTNKTTVKVYGVQTLHPQANSQRLALMLFHRESIAVEELLMTEQKCNRPSAGRVTLKSKGPMGF